MAIGGHLSTVANQTHAIQPGYKIRDRLLCRCSMSIQQISVNPPITPIVDLKTGVLKSEWWRFFNSLNSNVSAAAEGSVTTVSGSGLSGGGSVANGISLSIAVNGVSNAMIRQSAGTSVVGRFASSTGNVADIIAVADATVFTRQGNQLAFRPTLDGIGIGTNASAPLVNTDELHVASDPPATATSPGSTGAITWDSGFLYVCTATDTWKRVAIATF